MSFRENKEAFFNMIEEFWYATQRKKNIYCCNFVFVMDTYDKSGGKIKNKMFSKNHFVSSPEELAAWAWENRYKDCYINYNPLKTSDNRKNENVKELRIVALDIEFVNKRKPEPESRILLLRKLVEQSICKANQVDQYCMIESGNGLHLYMNIGKGIQKPIEELKPAYNKFVKDLSIKANDLIVKHYSHECLISADDRKDLAGILRVPGTTNTSANREIIYRGYNISCSNERLRKMIFSTLHKTKKALEAQRKLFKDKKYDEFDVQLPEDIDQLLAHPVIQMIFDEELPDVDGWHTTVGFAAQALVKFSGIPYYHDIQDLENEINGCWGSSLSLQHCNATNIYGPLKGAYNFAVKHGFEKYVDRLAKILRIRRSF